MNKSVGKSVVRMDAYEKATGRAKYMDDLCDRSAYVAKICHASIAHGYVKSIDTSAAENIPGVVRILTCFDVPNIPFPTAGHPWSTDPKHQDVADRLLLNRHVRYYGDDVAVVIAENEVAAAQAVRAIRVEYEELPFVLDVQKAMEPGAPQIHEEYCEKVPEFDFRLSVKAGLTGYAQVYGKYNTTTYDKLKFDMIYVQKASIILDLQLILLTLRVVFQKESTEGVEEGEKTAK